MDTILFFFNSIVNAKNIHRTNWHASEWTVNLSHTVCFITKILLSILWFFKIKSNHEQLYKIYVPHWNILKHNIVRKQWYVWVAVFNFPFSWKREYNWTIGTYLFRQTTDLCRNTIYIPNNLTMVKGYLYSDVAKIEHVNTNAFF